MASVFKPVYQRPIPEAATRCKLAGSPAVRFKDGRGKVQVHAIHRTRQGKLTDKMDVEQSHWWMRFTLPDGTERRERGFKDRTATEQEAARREALAQQQAAGMQVVSEEHLSAPLDVHREGFIDGLRRRGRAASHYELANARLAKTFAGCGWNTLRDLSQTDLDSFLADLADTAKPKTLNEYLSIAKQFAGWCVRQKRLAGNPFAGMERIEYDKEQDKAALTPEQAERLLDVAGHHRLLYHVALRTGLRRLELRALQWGDLHLDAIRPHAKLRAGTTKARRADTLPLRADVVEALRAAKPADAQATDKVFASLPRMHTFRRHLDAAGIPHFDEHGRKVCFHGLRVTFGTWLAQAGTAPRVHMEAMRHTDMKLTMNFYTDPKLLDTAGAVADLPELGAGTAAEQALALRTGTDNQPIQTGGETLLTKSTVPSVQNGPQGAGTRQQNTQKPLENRGFRMEAPGIEPGSRDVLAAASTCVVGLLSLADRARIDTVRHGQPDRMSRRGNRATSRR